MINVINLRISKNNCKFVNENKNSPSIRCG